MRLFAKFLDIRPKEMMQLTTKELFDTDRIEICRVLNAMRNDGKAKG